MKYLRGEAVSGYRYRSQKLGDIVNSAPVFLDDVIYAGGNDGMLHAFDADTGVEIFAYVPNLVFGNLKLLTDPAYTHRFYVDLTPTVKKGTGILGGTTTDTLLVGGLRKGGKGYFGLNVTNPKSVTTETELAQPGPLGISQDQRPGHGLFVQQARHRQIEQHRSPLGGDLRQRLQQRQRQVGPLHHRRNNRRF